MATKASAELQEIHIRALDRAAIKVTIIGQTPLIVNKMSAKARNRLLLGAKKMTAADRLELKHHPVAPQEEHSVGLSQARVAR